MAEPLDPLAPIFIHLFAPYALVNIYTRMALGEISSYAFFPILFLGLYNLINGDGKKHTLITVGAVGILLSHNISAVFAVVLSGIFVLFNIIQTIQKVKHLICMCRALILEGVHVAFVYIKKWSKNQIAF